MTIINTIDEVIDRLEYILTSDRIETCNRSTNIITDIQTDLMDLRNKLKTVKEVTDKLELLL